MAKKGWKEADEAILVARNLQSTDGRILYLAGQSQVVHRYSFNLFVYHLRTGDRK